MFKELSPVISSKLRVAAYNFELPGLYLNCPGAVVTPALSIYKPWLPVDPAKTRYWSTLEFVDVIATCDAILLFVGTVSYIIVPELAWFPVCAVPLICVNVKEVPEYAVIVPYK